MDDVDAALREFANQRTQDPSPAQLTCGRRETSALRMTTGRNRGRARMAPATLAHRETMCGGGALRHSTPVVGVHREDGSTLPLGYARLARGPGVNPNDYVYARLPSGWRVAVRRGDPARAQAVARQIMEAGPQQAGFVRVGDTFVPAHLSPGNRTALAQASSQ